MTELHHSEKTAEVPAPAKINLSLLVGPRRPDGYHPVCSVMEKVRLFDMLRVSFEDEGFGIRLTGSEIPAADNIVLRAVQALEQELGRRFDLDIELKKEIPVAAGLAGGSTDAAAILRLLTFMFRLELPPERLAEIAAGLGADVPFFLEPGPQLARGAGELLEPLPGLPDYAVVLVKPVVSISTAEVYALYDGLASPTSEDFEERCRESAQALASLSEAADLPSIMHNDLEEPAATLFPGLFELKQELLDSGALAALMSGSGPTVFGIYRDLEAAEAAAALLRQTHRQVWAATPFRE
ncbi:MAG: 4-(cytidine 5'-diphospho)-2-C-methyl-D-erythritol kinase [Actinobacteria bacterium]|nr:4-(cytidine 5'-diphospho)-2-C-methyl-D-erythritol kinase [Actinomycetota bacterium]